MKKYKKVRVPNNAYLTGFEKALVLKETNKKLNNKNYCIQLCDNLSKYLVVETYGKQTEVTRYSNFSCAYQAYILKANYTKNKIKKRRSYSA